MAMEKNVSSLSFTRSRMDWGELNADILCILMMKLGDISDVIRARAVCRHWRWSIRPCDAPAQLPWFIEHQPNDKSDREFFSLYSKRTHTLHVPEAKGKDIFGPSSRYFLIYDYRNHSVSVLNPFTRSHFLIPQIKNLAGFYPLYVGPYHNPNSNPNENYNFAVVSPGKNKYKSSFLIFCRFGDTQLTKTIEVPYKVDSIAYSQGRLFVFTRRNDEISVYDICTGDKELVISTPRIRFDYLIDACGDLIGVAMKYKRGGGWLFEVYRLEGDCTNFLWVMVNSIGDRMLFLNDRRTLGCGVGLKASDFEGFSGNCIYFGTWNHQDEPSSPCRFYLCRYDIEREETRAVPQSGNCNFPGEWFVPSLY